MSEPQTSLQKKEAQALQTTNGQGRGFEDIKRDDLIIPRLKLLQPLSPEALDGRGKPGDLFNSLTGENYGTEVSFVPIKLSYSRIFWGKQDEGGTYQSSKDQGTPIVCSSDNGKVPSPRVETPLSSTCGTCQYGQWQGKNPPRCTEFYTFPALINGDILAVSFYRTEIAVAKRLISHIVYVGKGRDMFAFKFKLRSKIVKGEKATYFNFDFAGNGEATPEEVLQAESFYTSMKERGVNVHEDAA